VLYEIAITPSVFYRDSYSSQDLCDAHMQGIWEPLMERLLVRDLRDGDWYQELKTNKLFSPFYAQKLLKQLKLNNRLIFAPAALPNVPSTADEWCQEALSSNVRAPLVGILACPSVKRSFQHEPIVASIAARSTTPWWQGYVVNSHPNGPRVSRTIQSYLTHLDRILRCASHIMFVDPHLDPTRHQYRDFLQLLQAAARSSGSQPTVEVHRVCYEGSPRNRVIVPNLEWERRFKTRWEAELSAIHLMVEVFIWNDEHDRHVISNLIGLHLGNGLDTTSNPVAKVTWTRMSRLDRDKVQRDFDPAVNGNKLEHRFLVGA
jgi:hypothetical protein